MIDQNLITFNQQKRNEEKKNQKIFIQEVNQKMRK